MNTRTKSNLTSSQDTKRLAPPLSWMVPVWCTWLVLYLGGGALAMQGETGFFAATVDKIDHLWVELAFLNLPLQLALMVVALITAPFHSRVSHGASRSAAWLVTTLMVVHVVLTLALELKGA